MKKLILIISLILLGACSPDNDDGKTYIVTTTSHIADAVRNISKQDNIRIESLMNEGVDPHLYRPLRSDIIKLKKADIIFYNGLHLEGRMVELLETFANEKPAYAVSDFTPHIINSNDGAHDPHIWMNVQNWIKVARGIEKTLKANNVYANAATYIEQLTALENTIKRQIETIPSKNRILVTAHDAFGYLGAAYGLEVIGLQGLSTESEASLSSFKSISQRIAEDKIPAIFIESSVSDKNITALIEQVRAKGHDVSIGGTLYSDALGQAGTPEGTYIGMMEHNIKIIAKGLRP